MQRKLLFFSIICLISVALSSTAWAAVMGTWDCSGVINLKASVKGHNVSETQTYSDTLNFGGDGSFGMTGISGIYAVKKNKFTVDLDNTAIENQLTSELVDAFTGSGYLVQVSNVVLTKEIFKGSENLKDGTIKGTAKFGLSMDIYFAIYNITVPVKLKATTVFLGTNHVPLQAGSVQAGKTLAGTIRDEVIKSLSGTAP